MHLLTMTLSPHERRQVAVAAYCSEQSLVRYLKGERLNDLVRARIENALRDLNLKDKAQGKANA